MRITFVHKTANFSGGNRVVATYAERLAARGHEVCVVSAPDARPRPLRKLVNRVRGRAFPVGDGRSWLDSIPVEHRVLDRARPVRAEDLPDADVIVATWWETAEWVAALPPSKGAPAYFIQGVEWTIDDMPAERVKQTWRLPLHKIVIAEFMTEIARTEFGDSELSYVPNAIDTALFHAPPRERNAVPTVGFMEVGPLAIKGGDITRAALLLAKQRVPELRGVCFGRSAPPPSRALPSWVDMHVSPSPEALRALYASCDVFVHASRAEGFGLPLLEAMACRTPVAATPAGAAPELLPSGGGQLVPHDDPAALADALVSLATLPPDAWRARSDAAHARATGYSLEDATVRMESALARAHDKAALARAHDKAALARAHDQAREAAAPGYARASARGDAGPPPELAGRMRALQPTSRRPDAAWVVRELLPPAALLDMSKHPDSPAITDSAATGTASTVMAALSHPATLAAIEDATLTRGLLLDPHAREQGRFQGPARAAPRRSFTVLQQDPPLRRRFTLIVPLNGAGVSLAPPPLATARVSLTQLVHPASRAHARALEHHDLALGDALLAPAGLDQLVDTDGLHALLLPLYQADLDPSDLPQARERVQTPPPSEPLARVQHAVTERAQRLRTRGAGVVAAARERLLGLH